MEVFKTILTLLGGLGVFLIALKIMSENLESVAGNKLRSVFNKISSNRFAGIAVGTGVTMVIQSSSATTVMVVGFVNAGVMTLAQATSIIMGANIGTTITAQIGALQSLPITAFFAALACVGAFMQMSKRDKVNLWGCIIGSIGMIFVGLQVMSSSMETFSDSPVIEKVMTSISNPVVLLLIGLTVTAIVQSSSATTIILITMAGANLMTLENALFITLGINIGTCVTAMFASIGTCCEGLKSTYQTVVGRSKSVWGPYVDKQGRSMMENHHELLIRGNKRFVGTGHNSELVTDDAGQDWILYHGVDTANPHGRVLLLDKVEWEDCTCVLVQL